MERWCHQVRATWSWERSQICRTIQVQKGGCFRRAPLGVYGIFSIKVGPLAEGPLPCLEIVPFGATQVIFGFLEAPKEEKGRYRKFKPMSPHVFLLETPHLCARGRWLAQPHHVPFPFLFHCQCLQSRASSFCNPASLIQFTWIRLLRFNCLTN